MQLNFSGLQRFGKSLMIPVALLPAAGILLGLGAGLSGGLAEQLPILQNPVIAAISVAMLKIGLVIFINLPMIFGVGIAVGLTNDSGIAGLSAFVGYVVMNTTIGLVMGITPAMAESGARYASILGIPTLQTGVFGGILVGLLAVWVYNKFKQFQPPQVLGFFAGTRSVGIITIFASVALGLALVVVWPPIQILIEKFALVVASGETNPIYIGFYGFLERLLIPTGLHHIWYGPFIWTALGGTTEVAGKMVSGDQFIFLAQMAAGEPITAGRFMAGKYPIIMFGLLGVALAIYREAEAANKSTVKGLLVAAAATSFLTGITEPIEFTFLFVAPWLYLIHSLLAGVSFALCYALEVHLGWIGGSGLIDYVLMNVIPGVPNWWMNFVLGALFFVIYFVLFTFAIRKFNLATPGRQGAEAKLISKQDFQNAKAESGVKEAGSGRKKTDKEKNVIMAATIVECLGGKENIKYMDSCLTRLRTELVDVTLFDEAGVKQLGAAGVVKVKNSLQIVFGGYSDLYKTEINKLLKQ